MVIIRRRDAKRWKNDYLVKGVSLPPLAYNDLAMKSSGIETLNRRMRTNLNRITNLALSTEIAILYSRYCGFVLFIPKSCQ